MKKIIKFNVEKKKIYEYIKKYHFKIEDYEMIEEVLAEINKKTDIYFYFEIENQVIYAVYTLGGKFDEILDKYHMEEDLMREYTAECLAQEILKYGYEAGEKIVYEVCGKYPGEYNFIGEDQKNDEELTELSYKKKIAEIFEMIKPDEVRLNTFNVMVPSKSVAFFAELENQDMKSCKNICKNCRSVCSYRNEERE